jgi:hypothetical protein
MVGGSAFAESAWRFRAQFKAAARAADALSPPRARFHDGMTSALNAACAVLVIGRCSLPLRALLRPDHPALLGTMLSRRSLVRCSLQRKHFSSDGRLQLLRCSCCASAAPIQPPLTARTRTARFRPRPHLCNHFCSAVDTAHPCHDALDSFCKPVVF